MVIEELFEDLELAELEKCDALALWENTDCVRLHINHHAFDYILRLGTIGFIIWI
jgi:hypothetical protein